MTNNMNDIAARLAAVRRRLHEAEDGAGRPADSVTLLAVSKTFPAEAVRSCAAAGQTRFGESYVQEAVDKIAILADLGLEWHFIGPLQSNKTRAVAENFHWVHSIERLKIAERLSHQRPVHLPPLQVCIQVNTSGEASKSGVPFDELPVLAAAVRALPNLHLRGLMTIPAPSDDPAEQRPPFRALREAFDQLNSEGYDLDTLSMGMSDDLEAAVAEGATMVRVGSAIFGTREYGSKEKA